MYISITETKDNQDVYIKQSYRKENGKTSSRIYKKIGKYNVLLEQFSGNEHDSMDWVKKEAEKETLLYNQQKEKVSISLSPLARLTDLIHLIYSYPCCKKCFYHRYIS